MFAELTHQILVQESAETHQTAKSYLTDTEEHAGALVATCST